MKKNRTIIPLVIVALALAFIVSCDEQELKFDSASTQKNLVNKDVRLNSSVGDPLDLTTAKRWVANFKKTSKEGEVESHFFGHEIINDILSQSDCMGIRIYYALDDNGEKKLVLVGVDSNGNYILPSEGAKTADGGGIIGDASLPCPTYCSGGGL